MNIRLVRETNHWASWFSRLVHCVLASVLTATPASLYAGATRIAGGDHHSCAVRLNGTVACWGRNHRGQLGNGSVINSSTPVSAIGLANVVAVAAGRFHSCAVLDDGTAWCWGRNASGQLGNGSNNSSSVPVAVSGSPARSASQRAHTTPAP